MSSKSKLHATKTKKAKKQKGFLYNIKVLLRLQKFAFKGTGWPLVVYYIILVFGAITPVINGWLFAKFIDATIVSVSVGKLVSTVWLAILGIFSVAIYDRLLGVNGFITYWLLKSVIDLKLSKYYAYFVHSRRKELRLEALENPKVANEMRLLENKMGYGDLWNVIYMSFDIIISIFMVISSAVVLFFKVPLLAILTIVLALPYLYYSAIRSKDSRRFWDSSINYIRKINRSWWTLTNYALFLKARLLGIVNYLIAKHGRDWFFQDEVRAERVSYWFLVRYPFSRIITALGDSFTLVYLALKAVAHQISIGSIGYYNSLTSQLRGNLRYAFSIFGNLAEKTHYVDRFFIFWEETVPSYIQESKTSRGIKVKSLRKANIVAEDLKYKYRGTTKYALENINLRIKAGQNIAIVGPNGAGKSTFVKTLLGHYINYSGSLKVGAHEVKDYNFNHYFSLFSVIPQEVHKLNFATVYDVITMDKFSRKYINFKMKTDVFDFHKIFKSKSEFKEMVRKIHDKKYKDVWQEVIRPLKTEKVDKKVIQVAKAVGLYEQIKSLPHGFFTYLSTDYSDGVDLSLGQWQRLHIARILYDPGDILILDEPTSAIDPLASFKLIDLIFEKFKDRTVIVVSHRYSTIAKADYIYVFDNGKVVEQGTHKELIKKNGYYAKAYKEEVERLKG